jgi:catalase
LAPHEKAHAVAAFSFELSHCDDPIVYKRMTARLADIDFDLARQVASNVGGTLPDKPTRANHGKTSKGLSQAEYLPKTPTIASRRIAILVADGVDMGVVQGLMAAIKGASALPWIIAPRRGTIYGAGETASKDEGLHADHHFEGQRSTMFDAIIIPSGSRHVNTLASNGRVVHWVREAFGHLKAIGAIGDGQYSFSALSHFTPDIRFSRDIPSENCRASWCPICS